MGVERTVLGWIGTTSVQGGSIDPKPIDPNPKTPHIPNTSTTDCTHACLPSHPTHTHLHTQTQPYLRRRHHTQQRATTAAVTARSANAGDTAIGGDDPPPVAHSRGGGEEEGPSQGAEEGQGEEEEEGVGLTHVEKGSSDERRRAGPRSIEWCACDVCVRGDGDQGGGVRGSGQFTWEKKVRGGGGRCVLS